VSVATYSTRFGLGWIDHRDGDLVELGLPGTELPGPATRPPDAVARLAIDLERYWRGDGPLPSWPGLVDAAGTTGLVRAMYDVVTRIPAGSTSTYLAVAEACGSASRARAVGAAMARNPFAPLIPCHRVVGSDGTLRGYGGGLEMKRYLLDMERNGA
jgi:methylated-DNA-[protein]-cysteine S-methyltransferase